MVNLFTQTNLNFKEIKKIGEGGEGNVYKAIDRQLNSIIAIKKVPIASFTNESKFFEEAKKLHLTWHQNIVQIKYGCKDDDFIYLAMPLYENGSLKKIMDDRFLSSREIIKYSLQFLAGLNHVHIKKLLHFDVKPENILLSNSNQALISDFGLAEYTGRYGFSKVNGTTRVFAPPELFSQEKHNVKFDIYQAGLAIYRMCVGDKVFFNQVRHAHFRRGIPLDAHFIDALCAGRFPDRSFYFSHIPKALRKIVRCALMTDPNDRYSSVLEMMNDLASINKSDDWIFETDYSTFERWTKPSYELNCTCLSNAWTVVATKNNRKNNSYCGQVKRI